VNVGLRLSRETLLQRYQHVAGGGIAGPPQPSASVRVGKQAQEAYARILPRLFQSAPGSDRDADLVVSVGRADVELRTGGWYALVEHLVELRTPSGGLIARWTVRGAEPIEGFGSNAVPVAFEGAAARAAHEFDLEWDTHDAVAAWLRGCGIEVLARRPVPPLLPGPAPEPPALPRGASIVFVDLGTALVPTAESLGPPFAINDYRRAPPSLAARAGLSGPHMLVQATGATWHLSGDIFSAAPQPSTLTLLGVDLAAVLRLGNRFEIAAGPGLHHLSAEGPGLSARATVPSLFAAVGYVGVVSARGIGVRCGADLHKYFAPTLVGSYGYTTRRELALTGVAVALHLGLELPLGLRLLP
jgi:hypothetical protein